MMSFACRIIFSLSIILLCHVICLASALKCYQCNSKLNPECKDIGIENTESSNNFTEFYKKCDVDLEGRKPFCRKIETLVFFGDEERIIRTCGWRQTSSNVSCYKADNQDHLETVCQCFTDGCNSAKHVFNNFTSMAIMIIIGFMIKYKLTNKI